MPKTDDSPEMIDKAEIPGPDELNTAIETINQEQTTELSNADVNESELIEIDKDSKRNSVDINKALTLRLKHGLSYGDIAKQLNVTKGGVWRRLKPFEDLIKDPDSITAYDANRANLLNSAEMTMLKEIVNSDKLKSASVNNLAYAYNTLFQARRLTLGESTANYSHHLISEKISDLDREEAAIRAELEGN